MRKRIFAVVFLSLFLSILFAVPGFGVNLELRHVGSWGTGEYFDISIKGNYAYCTADLNGMDILDISSPADIRKVGNLDTPLWANDIAIEGNYVYLAEEGLRIVDISNPTTPKSVGTYKIDEHAIINNLAVAGDYAYLACNQGSLDPNTNSGGLLIVDIRDPASPTPVGKLETHGSTINVYIQGNYAYIIMENGGLGIIDISDPTAPFTAGGFKYAVSMWGCDIAVKGDYAYLVDSTGMQVLDVSSPSACRRVATYESNRWGFEVYVKDNLLFTTWSCGCECTDSVKIFDISTPSTPVLLGFGYTPGTSVDMAVRGDHLFVADSYRGLQVLDISDLSNPTPAGDCDQSGMARGIALDKNHLYLGHGSGGLRVIDISSPGTPKKIADYRLNNATGTSNIVIDGQYAFAADSVNGLLILDISNPASPTLTGNVNTGWDTRDVKVKGNYAYTADCTEGLVVVDISALSNPAVKGTYATNGRYAVELDITDNYAYVVDGGLHIFDISNPLSVVKVGEFKKKYSFSDVVIKGNYAYVAGGNEGFYIVDVSDPSNPREVAAYREDLYFHAVDINGNYAYLAAEEDVMVVDISSPTSLRTVAIYDGTPGSPIKIMANGDYIYLADSSGQMIILETVEVPSYRLTVQSSPITAVPVTVLPADDNNETDGDTAFTRDYAAGTAVTLTAPELISNRYLFTGWALDGESLDGREITVTMDSKHTALASYRDAAGELGLLLSPSHLYFGGDTRGWHTAAQSVMVESRGPAAPTWTVQDIPDWLSVTPASGSGNGTVLVSVSPDQWAAGTYSGRFAVVSGDTSAAPQWVDVTLTVYVAGYTDPPFGTFTTPVEGTVVSGNVAFTGWVLDDIGVHKVTIYREAEDGATLVSMGTAALVEGARPDIEQAYPSYPMNTRAGWSYLMLTHFLPNGGNGTYTFHAQAVDEEGRGVTLGTKTVTVDNAGSGKPFGTLDTPAQGGTVSGSSFRNAGWVLTPQPNTIPTDGSTIRVWVDGVLVGNVDYNRSRPDVAALFPGYNNTDGAGGDFYLDTTAYSNGVHTISWTAADDAGNTEGIGSRYFTIWNTTASRKSSKSSSQSSMGPVPGEIPVDGFGSVGVVKGFRLNAGPREAVPGDKGIITITLDQMERLELHLTPGTQDLTLKMGFQVVGDEFRPLPTGSTFDRERGIFYWQPGPGFTGDYELVFFLAKDGKIVTKRHITAAIGPNKL